MLAVSSDYFQGVFIFDVRKREQVHCGLRAEHGSTVKLLQPFCDLAEATAVDEANRHDHGKHCSLI